MQAMLPGQYLHSVNNVILGYYCVIITLPFVGQDADKNVCIELAICLSSYVTFQYTFISAGVGHELTAPALSTPKLPHLSSQNRWASTVQDELPSL